MYPYECEVTSYGVVGTLPSGMRKEYATEEEYAHEYQTEEDEIVDALFELNNGYVIENDYNGGYYA